VGAGSLCDPLHLPSFHTDPARDWFTEETLSSVEVFLGALEYKCVAAEDSSDEDLEFQIREVLTHAGPWAIRERVKRLLDANLILLEPPFGPERFDIISPDLRIPMDRVTGYAQNRTLREEFPRDV